MTSHVLDDAEYYEAIIVGGPHGIAARIIGAKPREFGPGARRRLRAVLDSGYCIQVLSPDEATWRRNKANLLEQLGISQ